MKTQDPSHKTTKRAVQGLEALGTPSAKERKHYRVEHKADARPKKGDEVPITQVPITRVEPRAIRFPNRIGGK